MYTITFKDGSTCLGYLKNSLGKTYWVDSDGWELNDDLITWVEKV